MASIMYRQMCQTLIWKNEKISDAVDIIFIIKQ